MKFEKRDPNGVHYLVEMTEKETIEFLVARVEIERLRREYLIKKLELESKNTKEHKPCSSIIKGVFANIVYTIIASIFLYIVQSIF